MISPTLPQCMLIVAKQDYNTYVTKPNVLASLAIFGLFGLFLLGTYIVFIPIFTIAAWFPNPIFVIMFIVTYTLTLFYAGTIIARGINLFIDLKKSTVIPVTPSYPVSKDE